MKDKGGRIRLHLPDDGALCSLGDTTSGYPEAQTRRKSGKIHVNGVRGNVIPLGLHLCLWIQSSIVWGQLIYFLTNPDSFSPLAPGAYWASSPYPWLLSLWSMASPDTVHSVRFFKLSILLLKCLSICSLPSVPTATKRVLGTFHLDSGGRPLARIPASSHSTLPCAS